MNYASTNIFRKQGPSEHVLRNTSHPNQHKFIKNN